MFGVKKMLELNPISEVDNGRKEKMKKRITMTNEQKARRSIAMKKIWEQKRQNGTATRKYCRRGHLLIDENCYIYPKTKYRTCLKCKEIRVNGYKRNGKNKEYERRRRNTTPKWKLAYRNAKSRAYHKSGSYFKRGLSFSITEDFVKKIWFRDKAYLMKRPSIDRFYGDIGYTEENTRFIELRENQTRERILSQ